jgi:ubiquinone/menaquinone biosynthesis C-methylase UbiE
MTALGHPLDLAGGCGFPARSRGRAGEEGVGERDGIGAVIHFYETHPINEEQILHRLNAAGIPLDGLTEDVLQDHDQDHFGGLEQLDILARKAGIGPETHVLDVCSGVGGPARYLAQHYRCRVTGLDITEGRHRAALRFTRLVGLDHLVDFRLGNALEMPFEDASFDVVISEEAFAHVPQKARLIGECARVLRPGGRIAFTDIVCRDELAAEARARLEHEMTFLELETLDGYAGLLEAAGCTLLECQDLGPLWTRILKERLAMYRSLEDTTVEKFGLAHFQRWDEAYAFFVGLFGQDQLTGGRFVARRAA